MNEGTSTVLGVRHAPVGIQGRGFKARGTGMFQHGSVQDSSIASAMVGRFKEYYAPSRIVTTGSYSPETCLFDERPAWPWKYHGTKTNSSHVYMITGVFLAISLDGRPASLSILYPCLSEAITPVFILLRLLKPDTPKETTRIHQLPPNSP